MNFSRPKIWLWLALALAAVASLLACQSVRWAIVKTKIRSDFPDVPRIGTGALAAWLGDLKREPPLLLDVRTRAEFEVSHLANARRVEPGSDPVALALPRDRPIVAYCSVGARSSAFADGLLKAGYEDVANLEGSIFQWVNEGRPVVRGGHPTETVHPFNALWGTLVDKAHHADAPPP